MTSTDDLSEVSSPPLDVDKFILPDSEVEIDVGEPNKETSEVPQTPIDVNKFMFNLPDSEAEIDVEETNKETSEVPQTPIDVNKFIIPECSIQTPQEVDNALLSEMSNDGNVLNVTSYLLNDSQVENHRIQNSPLHLHINHWNRLLINHLKSDSVPNYYDAGLHDMKNVHITLIDFKNVHVTLSGT